MKKVITISDTHGKHHLLTDDIKAAINESPYDPENTILIHAGDVSNVGKIHEINDFTNWFSQFDVKAKIFIAGNHDFGFEKIRHSNEPNIIIPQGVIYLQDEMVEIDDLKIYGSPWQPEFYNWAFNLRRGPELAEKWALIPDDTDILITHGPAYRMLDHTDRGESVGCLDLFDRIMQVKPKYHIFGHIHFAHGTKEFNNINFINASSLGETYHYENNPIVFHI
jgi:hypothetical protein